MAQAVTHVCTCMWWCNNRKKTKTGVKWEISCLDWVDLSFYLFAYSLVFKWLTFNDYWLVLISPSHYTNPKTWLCSPPHAHLLLQNTTMTTVCSSISIALHAPRQLYNLFLSYYNPCFYSFEILDGVIWWNNSNITYFYALFITTILIDWLWVMRKKIFISLCNIDKQLITLC